MGTSESDGLGGGFGDPVAPPLEQIEDLERRVDTL
jgi:hypothetical protein